MGAKSVENHLFFLKERLQFNSLKQGKVLVLNSAANYDIDGKKHSIDVALGIAKGMPKRNDLYLMSFLLTDLPESKEFYNLISRKCEADGTQRCFVSCLDERLVAYTPRKDQLHHAALCHPLTLSDVRKDFDYHHMQRIFTTTTLYTLSPNSLK